jgi:hypothetical protein
MSSACERNSTAADAMAVQLDRQLLNSSDDDSKEADCSQSLHKKEMLYHKNYDKDDPFS